MSMPSMPIERYAQMRADMEAGRLRDEVLAHAGITVEMWTTVQGEWLEKMGAELEQGRFELTNRYTQAFVDRQRALTAAERRAPDPPEIEPSLASAAPVAPATPPLTPADQPSAVRLPQLFVVDPEHAPDETLPLMARGPVEAARLPFEEVSKSASPSIITPPSPAPTPAHPAPWLPLGMRGGTDIQSTLDASSGRPPGPALPFDPTSPSQLSVPSDASSRVPKGLRGISDLGSTVPLTDPPETATLPLPSQAAALEPVPPKFTSPDWLPPGMRGFSDVHGTQIAPAAPPTGPALPFDESAPPSLPPPSKAPAWMPKAMQSITDIGGTQAAPSAPTRPALPFAAAEPPTRLPHAKAADPPPSAVPVPQHQPGHPPARQDPARASSPSAPELARSPAPELAGPPLPLDAYACLHVELALNPAARLNILRRYGLDEQQQRQLDAFWGARIAIDAALRKTWENCCSAHRARLLQAQRPPR